MVEAYKEQYGRGEWICGECGETYDLESEAENCCKKNINEDGADDD